MDTLHPTGTFFEVTGTNLVGRSTEALPNNGGVYRLVDCDGKSIGWFHHSDLEVVVGAKTINHIVIDFGDK